MPLATGYTANEYSRGPKEMASGAKKDDHRRGTEGRRDTEMRRGAWDKIGITP